MKVTFSTKLLVVISSCVLLAGFTLIVLLEQAKQMEAIPLFTERQPSLGSLNAPVHVVVFEDPKCNNCIIYHRTTFAPLKSEFIDSGKVRYTVFLVSGLKQSATISNFLFCINSQSTKAFFDYLHTYYENPPLALDDGALIVDLKKKAQALKLPIDIAKLNTCAADHGFAKEVMDNTNYARAIMGGVIKTPSVFVNGKKLSRPSYNELRKAINSELKSR